MWRNTLLSFLAISLLSISLTSCTLLQPLNSVNDPVNKPVDKSLSIAVTATEFMPDPRCDGTFTAHELDHITTVSSDPVQMFDSNGAGLAVNDLDQDGAPDLVFANLRGNNAIFWNEGNLIFQKQALTHGQSRAAATVDVDGDGLLDVVFTQRTGSISYWHNEGERRFVKATLSGVQELAYAMNWADLDGDNDLDLVTASYDAGLEKELGSGFLLGKGAGIFYFENQDGAFLPTQLAEKSQALAIYLGDLSGDQKPDILVGNDFAIEDQFWVADGNGWQATQPFSTTTHSTMSYTAGDINNDGQPALFATDMKPYADDEATRNAWRPVMEMMPDHHEAGDPQVMENVLQVPGVDGTFENSAGAFGLDATGWSWSAKFGDLDHDGFLDLYVVNGMTAHELFGHLPGGELVERNQALRNDGGNGFVAAPDWALDATTSGRGMSLADLDGDGDLDVIVNNLLTPAQLFENRLCGGESLTVGLNWPDSQNKFALGATLRLDTSAGIFTRQIQAMSGYLSGDPSNAHFGFPTGTALNQLEIRWPDGTVSHLTELSSNAHLQIERLNQ